MDILYIIWFDVLPILIFLGGGWFLAGKFKIEVKTYEIVITRVVLPCFVFFNLYQVPPTTSDLLLLPAALLLTAILFVLSALLAQGLSQEPSLRQAICGMASCPNVCYLGGVLTYLTFSHLPFASAGEAAELPKALALLSLLMTLSHLLLRTVGHAIVSKESSSLSSLLLRALTTPVLYGALLAFAAAHFDIPLKGTFLYPRAAPLHRRLPGSDCCHDRRHDPAQSLLHGQQRHPPSRTGEAPRIAASGTGASRHFPFDE